MEARQSAKGASAIPRETPSVIFRTTSKRKNAVMAAPMPPRSHQKRPPSRPQVRPLESDAALVSVRRRSVFMAVRGGNGGGCGGGKKKRRPPPRCAAGAGDFFKDKKPPRERPHGCAAAQEP